MGAGRGKRRRVRTDKENDENAAGSAGELKDIRGEELTLPYADIELAGDEELEFFIRIELHKEPKDCRFTRTKIAVSELRGQAACLCPEDYLFDDDEEGYDRLWEMIAAYNYGGADSLPPVVIWDDQGKVGLLDGRRRVAAALEAGVKTLPAYKLF